MTVCVFAWEERARQSCIANREQIEARTKDWTRPVGGLCRAAPADAGAHPAGAGGVRWGAPED